MDRKEIFTERTFCIFISMGILLNACCFFSQVLEPDGALYASIAKHMANTNDWINLWGNGADWLDKPHLPFWLTAASFKLFGISAFTYKLPSFLCWLAGIWYTYKLAEKVYSTAIAQLAAIIYVTALHVILSNADVRAEGYLTTFIVAGTYYMYLAYINNKIGDIVLAALFCAFAIMTKGIFTIVTISSGFVIYWIINKEWKEFIKPKWYLLIVLIFIFILPELYCLYTQFDLHPEKIIFGKTHVSGIHFFFWDSQFGRFMNNGPIKGSGDIFFFLHTTFWAFLPWSVILLIVLIGSFRKTAIAANKHALIIGGSAFITFLMFSLSKFQLPHYIVIIFPHLAMITSYWMMEKASDSVLKKLSRTQTLLFTILSVLAITIMYFTGFCSVWIPITISITITFTLFLKTCHPLLSIVKKNIGFAILLALFLNGMFYHRLLTYQGGMMAGKWMNETHPGKTVTMYQCNQYSFEFYCKGNVERADTTTTLFKADKDTVFIFTPFRIVNRLQQNDPDKNITVLSSFSNFHVSQVTTTFLNKHTRQESLDTLVITMITNK
jgi:4-amino-4-deoxy-L-arabinose transferase-like glycosyltransferase